MAQEECVLSMYEDPRTHMQSKSQLGLCMSITSALEGGDGLIDPQGSLPSQPSRNAKCL